MGQQTKTIVKRRRRKLYLKRKKEQTKAGGVAKKSTSPKKADTALRIERYLGISASLLLRLQADFDLGKASEEKGEELKRTIRPAAA